MEKRYFLPTEDFKSIICETLNSENISVSQISTGWTNTVFKASNGNNSYIFRFPRNNYWSDVLENECEFNKYLVGQTKVKTSKLNLCYNNNRPFSWHVMIKGKTLAESYPELTFANKQKIAEQIASFLVDFQKIDVSSVPLNIGSTSKFLENLSQIEDGEYDLEKHNPLIKQETSNECVLAHGDLNAGNILIDDNNEVCAILDFAFVSKSSLTTDIGRIIGRLPLDFKDIMIEAYNKNSLKQVLASDIAEIVDVYNYVDTKYIEFIKRNYPEIQV